MPIERRTMWLIVFFDLPVKTANKRRAYTQFRKKIMRYGFSMRQYSVYETHCPTNEAADKYTRKISEIVPKDGKVSILRISDAQFGSMIHFYGKMRIKPLKSPIQLELF